jgi:uncharacterized protein YidB (DUF937 family)
MSLLGDLAKSALGNVLGGQQSGAGGAAALAALLPAATGLIQKLGGIGGIQAKFQQAGLGDKIASWIGTGPNPPTTAEEVKKALGDHLSEIAQQTGQDPNATASGLAAILPGLIDHLTPNGQAPGGTALTQGIESLLKGGLGKIFG